MGSCLAPAFAFWCFLALSGFFAVLPLPANADPTLSGSLQVAVYNVPPYGYVGADGAVSGLSVDLWRRVAERMQRQFKLTPINDMGGLLLGVRQGRFDVAIGAITITPERERLVDFSYPAHRSGVAVALHRQSGPFAALEAYLKVLSELGSLVGVIFVSLVATGVVMWLIERSGRAANRGESHVTTLRDGLYWAVVTMTTVGYGDKTPKTTSGRFVATLWMFGSLVMISLLSTSLVSRLTADRVEGSDNAVAMDLAKQTLVAVADSSGAEYLDQQHLAYIKKRDLTEALDSLRAGDATALVNSVGALKYFVARSYSKDIEVSSGLLAPAYMAFALPPHSDLAAPINEALIKITSGREWTRIEDQFFDR